LKAQTKELIASTQGTAPLAEEEMKKPEPPEKPRKQKKRSTGFSMAGKAEGTAKLATTDSLTIPMNETESALQNRATSNRFDQLSGMALINDRFENAATVWTAQAQEGFDENLQVSIPSLEDKPAILSHPIHLRNEKNGSSRLSMNVQAGWTAEEKRLIQEVAHHLGLALENSQLYSTIQRELSERVRAEREALRRNKDLANLNHISQQLTQLASRQQIFETVADMTQKIMGVENVLLAFLTAMKIPSHSYMHGKRFTYQPCAKAGNRWIPGRYFAGPKTFADQRKCLREIKRKETRSF
jgi:K+-sensing histidine kinase KdpD